MGAGAHSAAYTGTVALLGPMPIPRMNLATKRCCQELVTPCHMQVRNENNAVIKIVPRRPNHWFSCINRLLYAFESSGVKTYWMS